MKGLDVDVNPDASTVTGGQNPGWIISYTRSNEEKETEAALRFLIMTVQLLSVSSNFFFVFQPLFVFVVRGDVCSRASFSLFFYPLSL